jgi:hypothetical protein
LPTTQGCAANRRELRRSPQQSTLVRCCEATPSFSSEHVAQGQRNPALWPPENAGELGRFELPDAL